MNSFMKATIMIMLLQGLFLLDACTTEVSAKEAEQSAFSFIQEHVRFIPKGDSADNMKNTTKARLTILQDSYDDDEKYVFVIKAEADSKNGSVKNEFVVEVEKTKGRVVKFNGQDILLQ